jgi:cysteine desulfurase
MKKIYFDNAATTQIRPEVVQEMTKIMLEDYGNPSSSHSFGRSAKSLLELSRKSIAKNLNCSAQEIIFTSGGTEANNFILKQAVAVLKIQRIISSKIEHHAVLHTIQSIEYQQNIKIDFVKILPNGAVDLTHLVELLSQNIPTLVSLMHINNETGTVLDIEYVAKICKEYNAFFHTDAVQSVGKTEIDLQSTSVDFLAASAHKFHGPKGIGFAFIRKGITLNPMIIGGEQEKGLRAGTESLHNIVGMTKALEFSYQNLDEEKDYILYLKNYCINQLLTIFSNLKINGENTFYNILNVLLPISPEKTPLLLFNLDMKGIAVSRGSACQSGSSKPSHVLTEILNETDLAQPSIRISFSHYNNKEEIDYFIEVLKNI